MFAYYDSIFKKWNIAAEKKILLFGIAFAEIERIKHLDKLFLSKLCSIMSWAMFAFNEYLNLILFYKEEKSYLGK